MKKYLPYILLGVMVIAVLVLFFTSKNEKTKVLDERITFNKKDKIPYGTYVAYENLRSLFPRASLSVSRQEPGYWDSLSTYDEQQALLIISPKFDATEFEMKKILRFAESGNDVFISTVEMPYDVMQLLHCNINTTDKMLAQFIDHETWDTLKLRLAAPPYQAPTMYSYPGKRFDLCFSKLDTLIATELGYDGDGTVNFAHFKPGKGNLYIHLAPMAFTNYFLMHGQNMGYYEQALSVISPATKKIVWDEYYLAKRTTENKKPNWFMAFMTHKGYEGLKWGILIALFLLLLYVLMEMRRKQRPIPVMNPPVNDSLEFVKTIGRLYYDKGDHKNLSRKMAAYFLDHVRNRYKLATTDLNEDFARNLHFKTGYDEEQLRNIVYFIKGLDNTGAISDKQLASFHQQLESFYSKT